MLISNQPEAICTWLFANTNQFFFAIHIQYIVWHEIDGEVNLVDWWMYDHQRTV